MTEKPEFIAPVDMRIGEPIALERDPEGRLTHVTIRGERYRVETDGTCTPSPTLEDIRKAKSDIQSSTPSLSAGNATFLKDTI